MIQNQSAPFDQNTVATHVVAAAVAGKRIIVYNYALVNGVATAQSITFKSGSTSISGVMQLPLSVGGGIAHSSADQSIGLFMTAPGEALGIALSAATQVGGHVSFKYV